MGNEGRINDKISRWRERSRRWLINPRLESKPGFPNGCLSLLSWKERNSEETDKEETERERGREGDGARTSASISRREDWNKLIRFTGAGFPDTFQKSKDVVRRNVKIRGEKTKAWKSTECFLSWLISQANFLLVRRRGNSDESRLLYSLSLSFVTNLRQRMQGDLEL